MGTLIARYQAIGRKRSVFYLARCALLFVFLVAPFAAHAQNAELQIKAAFLYHFCSYVQWPEYALNNPAHITIGVAGPPAAVRLIRETLAGKTNPKCTFHVRAVKPSNDLSDIEMLYIAHKSRFSLEDFLASGQLPPILTITDKQKTSEKSMINFVVHEDHVRFVISKTQADQAGLKLSSELLAVALEVK